MPDKGRAAIFHGVGKPFEIRQYDVPDPRDRDLVVKISRANICGSDLHLWRGDTDLARMGITYGIVLGHEMCGVVHKLGRKTRSDALGRTLKEGDRVVFTYYVNCGHCHACLQGDTYQCMQSLATPVRPTDMHPHFTGGFADYYYVKQKQSVFKVPDDVSDEMVCGANCALSQVIFGLQRANLKFGDRVVVQGAGGLGLFACAVAKDMGADRVIAIDAVPARLEAAKAFGADEVIDVSQVTDARARTQMVMGMTAHWGADVVVEVAGLPQVVPEGIRMLARGGRYCAIGNINPKQTYKEDPSLLVGYNRSIIGVSLYPPDVLRRAVDFLRRAQDRYPFASLSSHAYDLEDIDRAFVEADAFGKQPGPVTRASLVMGA